MNNSKTHDTVCPYCGTALSKVPVRKSKCKHCEQDIYVKTKQRIFPSSLLTKQQADIIDEMTVLENTMRLTEKDFNAHREMLSKHFGKQASLGDTLWSIYNDLTLALAKKGDFDNLITIYYQMAIHLQNEGKDGTRMLKEAKRARLIQYKKMGAVGVEIQASYNVCGLCKELDGKNIKIETALQQLPLPPKECNCAAVKDGFGYCACDYRAIFKEELEYGDISFV